MARSCIFILLIVFLFLPVKILFAQQSGDTLQPNNHDTLTALSDTLHLNDSVKKNDTVIVTSAAKDSSGKSVLALDTAVKFNPKVAMLRSAILPGWGQWYNKKYWKIPIIYGALGISASVFFYNLKTYRELRQSVIYRARNTHEDSLRVPEEFRSFSTQFLRVNRNAFRQNIDYSVLAFLVLWGLNVVDATVDAHLKAFDVSPDIGMKLSPNLSGNNKGVSLVFFFKDKNTKPLSPLP
jgi:hypothetical protein